MSEVEHTALTSESADTASQTTLEYVAAEVVSISNHPQLNELWVQKRIAEKPSILGLGDLYLKDWERRQPQGGRLDILLQSADDPPTRYEVEIQLGASNETHIIRTIEYWDVERRRYPQYDHVAVPVAEDITSRFLNVVGLFNGFIPIIGLQMQALRVAGKLTLVFTKAIDVLTLGLVDEDEEIAETADRAYWLKRGSVLTVDLTEEIFGTFVKPNDGELKLKYNKQYIGLSKNGQPINFVKFLPRKKALILRVKLPRTTEIDEAIDEAGIETLEYNRKWEVYRLRLTKDDLTGHHDLLARLIREAYQRRVG